MVKTTFTSPAQIHAPDLIPVGMRVAVIGGKVQDRAPVEFDVSRLRPRQFLRGREVVLDGNQLRLRATELAGNWSLSDGKRMLENQHLIAKELQDFHVPLTETVLCDEDGSAPSIAYLVFDGSAWHRGFRTLPGLWIPTDRLACIE